MDLSAYDLTDHLQVEEAYYRLLFTQKGSVEDRVASWKWFLETVSDHFFLLNLLERPEDQVALPLQIIQLLGEFEARYGEGQAQKYMELIWFKQHIENTYSQYREHVDTYLLDWYESQRLAELIMMDDERINDLTQWEYLYSRPILLAELAEPMKEQAYRFRDAKVFRFALDPILNKLTQQDSEESRKSLEELSKICYGIEHPTDERDYVQWKTSLLKQNSGRQFLLLLIVTAMIGLSIFQPIALPFILVGALSSLFITLFRLETNLLKENVILLAKDPLKRRGILSQFLSLLIVGFLPAPFNILFFIGYLGWALFQVVTLSVGHVWENRSDGILSTGLFLSAWMLTLLGMQGSLSNMNFLLVTIVTILIVSVLARKLARSGFPLQTSKESIQIFLPVGIGMLLACFVSMSGLRIFSPLPSLLLPWSITVFLNSIIFLLLPSTLRNFTALIFIKLFSGFQIFLLLLYSLKNTFILRKVIQPEHFRHYDDWNLLFFLIEGVILVFLYIMYRNLKQKKEKA